jgi:hypothetical protein
MLHILILVLVVGIVVGFTWWIMDFIPVPEPLNKIVKVASMVVGVIVIIYALLGLAGMGPGISALS